MKFLYPHFDFSTWITEYYLAYTFLAFEKVDEDLYFNEKEVFLEMLEHFEDQHHINHDEGEICYCCAFLQELNNFNELMAIISCPKVSKVEILEFFLKKRFPSNNNHTSIAKALMFRIKGYNAVDKHGNIVNFSPMIINNINKFLTKLQINVI